LRDTAIGSRECRSIWTGTIALSGTTHGKENIGAGERDAPALQIEKSHN
jgi:hypothetical protein